MRENVTISFRGASYEIGRGPHFYGIWVVGAPQPQPVEWWPETPEGWSSAWARFTGIEAPGTITAVRQATSGATRPAPWPPPGPASQGFAPGGPATRPGFQPGGPAAQPGFEPGGLASQPGFEPGAPAAQPGFQPGSPGFQPGMSPTPVGHPAALVAEPGAKPGWPGQLAASGARAGVHALVAAGLLVIGVALGIASLFPSYLFGASLASSVSNLVLHVIYLVAWAGSVPLILLGGARLRMGALLAAGTSIVTFGLFVSDAGWGTHAWGTGLVLGLIGWLACAAGSAMAVRLRRGDAPGRPRAFAARHLLTVLAALAALGTAITFAPAWDGYTLRVPGGGSLYRTAGNAFASINPGWVITGDVLAMIAVVLAVVVAALWRPVREGAWLLAGAVIPMAAQAISALVQVGEPTSPTQFGITPGQAQQAGLTITNSLTPAFWLFCAFVVVLMVGCMWLLLSPRATDLDTPGQRRPYGPAGGPSGPMPYAWPHPFTGGAPETQPGTVQPGTVQPGTAQPGTVQPETAQAAETAQASWTPGAPGNTGLGILGSAQDGTEPDILDSAQGKVEPDAPEPGAQN